MLNRIVRIGIHARPFSAGRIYPTVGGTGVIRRKPKIATPSPEIALTGSCLCGAIRYTLSCRIPGFTMCHCSQCRKASGTAYAANASVPTLAFNLLKGFEELKEYESSPGKMRAFCGNCGSPIYARL
eukprot:gnl/TRDRNA2_/TRDRNA2_133914_c0_seq3.p1 gnl/TRDRNA2_/TRDRNA2_133914_c0~~gnl/TRDRNA2_/TRDRNA2_133914_c0_seq3.p1  ORF type:complete len:127 (+),score=6.21 gnl/TRDRNA2_/TRDRNA2_133914_c0_seq3:93-473(+)